MDLICINDDKFPARNSRDFKNLMDAAINGGKWALFKWACNYSIFPWNWRFKEINILNKSK